MLSRVFHYTNEQAASDIFAGTLTLNDYCREIQQTCYRGNGLLPIGRFVSLQYDVPEKAHEGSVCALLEPEPDSWIKSQKYPNTWLALMHDICEHEKVYLLSFEITAQDRAFVADRARIEDYLYNGRPEENTAYRNYFNSLVPISSYKGGYSLPEVHIFNKIAVERLQIVPSWPVSSEELFQKYSKERNK